MDTTTAAYIRRGVALMAAAIVHAGKAGTIPSSPGKIVADAQDFMKFMEGRTR